MTCPNCEYAEGLKAALRVAKSEFEMIHDRCIDNVDVDEDASGHRSPNTEGHVVTYCNVAIEAIDRALAAPSVAQGTTRAAWSLPFRLCDACLAKATAQDTYTAPVPPGFTHALDCAYKASPRYHCTCGYVDKEGA